LQVPAIPGPARASAQGVLTKTSASESTVGIALTPVSALRGLAPRDAAPVPAQDPTPVFAAEQGSPYREPGLQQRLGQLQQGVAYAEQLGQALQGLKGALSQALVRQQGQPDAALQDRLETVRRLWQARGEQGGGLLDAQLQPVADGEAARQRFRLRGLDLAALAQGGAETLRLSLPGQPRSIAVPLDGQGLQRQLQSLQRALAPTDLRVETQGGELQFSAPESQWPALRDGFSIRGDGKRFPSGQMVRAPLDPQAEALSPAQWQLEGSDAQRRALAQVLGAQERLAQARQRLSQRLAEAASAPEPARDAVAAAGEAETRQAVHDFAAAFAASTDAAQAPLDYEQLSALVPALLGLHRRQVQQLLLPSGAA